MTLRSAFNFGSLLSAEGKHAEALPLLQDTLTRTKAQLGDKHQNCLEITNKLAEVLESSGSIANAEASYREAYEGYRQQLGPHHRNTLMAVNNLAALLKEQGRL